MRGFVGLGGVILGFMAVVAWGSGMFSHGNAYDAAPSSAIVVSKIVSFDSAGIPVIGNHLTVIKGSMTNNFAYGDAWCYSGSFKLIGEGRTLEPASGDCEAFKVARGTKTDFTFSFAVKDPGAYELRFQKFSSDMRDFLTTYETAAVSVT